MKTYFLIALSALTLQVTPASALPVASPVIVSNLEASSPLTYRTRRAELLRRIDRIARLATEKGDLEILAEAQNLESIVVSTPDFLRPGDNIAYWSAVISSGERTCTSLERALDFDPEL